MSKKNEVRIPIKVDGKEILLTKKQVEKLNKDLDKTGTSAHSADRRLKGAAQASSGATKNFSKMAQGIQGGLVPAYATLAASLFAVGAVFRAFQNAADFQALQASQQAYAASTGVMLGSVSASLQKATQGQIDLQKAGSAAAIMIAKGFTTEQIDQVAKASTAAAQSLGRNFEDTFNRIVQGTTKAEPELLDELGITLRLETATQKYADAIGKSRDELTTYERSQAVLNETLRQAEENFGAVAGKVPVNSFNKLGVVMTDLTMSFQQAFAPIANFFANILGNNLGAAVAALGLFASSIIGSVIPSTDEMISNIDEWAGKHTAAYNKAKEDILEYSAAQKKASMDVEAGRAQGKADLQTSAQRLGKTDSPVLKRAQRGTLKGADIPNLDKALKSAEAQYKKHGKIVSGIFKGKDIQVVKSMKASFKQMNMQTRTWWGATKATLKKVRLGFKVAAAGIKAGWQATMAGMGKATARFGAFAGKVMGKAGTIGIIIMVFQVIKGMVDNIDKIIIGSMTMIGKLIDGVIFMVDKMLGVIAKIPGPMGKIAKVAKDNLPEAGKFTEQFKDMGKAFVEEKGLDTFAQNRREGAAANDRMNESLDATKEKIEAINGIINTMKANEAKGKKKSYLETLAFEANALSTSGIVGEIDKLAAMRVATKSDKAGGGKAFTEEQIQKQEDATRSLFESLKLVVPSLGLFGDVLDLDSEKLMHFITQNQNAGNTLKTMKQLSESALARRAEASKSLASGFFDKELTDLTIAQNQYASLVDKTQILKDSEAKQLAELLGVSKEVIAGKSIGDILGIIHTKTGDVQNAIDRQRQLSLDRLENTLSTAHLGNRKDEGANRLRMEAKLRNFKLEEESIEIKLNELAYSNGQLDSKKMEANRVLIQQEKLKLAIIQEQRDEYQRSNTIVGQLNDTMKSGLDEMFLSIIQGTASAKDALKQLAIVVIQEMQKIAAARMAAGMIDAMAGFMTPGQKKAQANETRLNTQKAIDTNIKMPEIKLPGGRYGGVFGKKAGYSLGGVADGPDSGYNVTMHGREAIVPLPNGDKIPVEMRGNTGPVNSTINITVNNEGESEVTTQESSALGEAIQVAVTKEIANQQRPGGLLSSF